MTRPANPTAERIELAQRVAEMRASGMLFREIAGELGKSPSYLRNLASDPRGDKARARKDRGGNTCADCGTPVSYESVRCMACANRPYWTQDRIIAAIREWAAMDGSPPTATDWNSALARTRRDTGEHPLWSDYPGKWPTTWTAAAAFGSWNAAIAAAGFVPRMPGGRGAERYTMEALSGSTRSRMRTTCRRGHDLTDPKNVYVYGDRRFCAECHRAANRRWQAKRRAIEVSQ